MNFGKTLAELRKQKNMTQEELAAQLGVTAAAVSKWENGYTLPDILMLCALADHFGVTTDTLLGRVSEGKYAAIAAQDKDLRQDVESLARRYGITTLYLCADFQSALDYANGDARVTHLLVSCEDARFSMENMQTRDGLQTIVSVGENRREVLNGFEMMLRG